VSVPGALERTLDEHRVIADALEAGDAELAAAASRVHIAGVENWIRSLQPGWSVLAAEEVHSHS
jgi:GntR family transcriptional repressor for pyruvate dehydrogenase complex